MAGTDRCAAADDVAGTAEPIPNVAAMLAPGKVLNVLTVGSATVFSPEASFAPGTVTSQALGLSQAPVPAGPVQTSERAFPSQMAKALQLGAPGAEVRITTRGGRGMTAAEMLGVMLFRRFDLMRTWANEGQIDLERTPRADRQRTIEILHQCLGNHLARLILSAARS